LKTATQLGQTQLTQ